VGLLRAQPLTKTTLKNAYDDTIFEQVAESNAIEGSTLDVNETRLAITQGVTLSGHDPNYVHDAKRLHNALVQIQDLIRSQEPLRQIDIRNLHNLILEGDRAAGRFRSVPVQISGATHTPPASETEITRQMITLGDWSDKNRDQPAPIRAAVLHTWLVHIHPFLDGNGRTARAVANLELIKGGFPPVIIRKTDRERYYQALADSDQGNLLPFLDFFIEKVTDSLSYLEQKAKEHQDYNPIKLIEEKINRNNYEIYNNAIRLLISHIEGILTKIKQESPSFDFELRKYSDSLSFEDFKTTAILRQTIANSWCFSIKASLSGYEQHFLAKVGFRSYDMQRLLEQNTNPAPSLFWNVPNPELYPRWRKDSSKYLAGTEITLTNVNWLCLGSNRPLVRSTDELARIIVDDLARHIERAASPTQAEGTAHDFWIKGNEARKSKQFALAEEKYLEALRLKPKDPNYMYSLALAFLGNQNVPRASQLFQEVISHPHAGQFRRNAIKQLYSILHLASDQAKVDYLEGLLKQQSDQEYVGELTYQMGLCWLHMGDMERFMQTYLTLLPLNQNLAKQLEEKQGRGNITM
jgi:Fic family protein